MSRVLTALAILLSFAAIDAQPLRHTYSEAFRRPALDVALGGERLWIADGYGVTIATRANPPEELGHLPLQGTTSRISASGNEAWVVSGTTLHRVGWSGERIVRTGTIEIGQPVFDLVEARGFLYLAIGTGVLQVDTTFSSNRMTLPTTSGVAASLATDGSTLVAADGDGSAEIYNVEFPALAQKIGVAQLSISNANRVNLINGQLLVSNGRDSEMFGSVRPPFSSLGIFAAGSSSAAGTTPGIVFAAGQDSTVRILDLRFSAGPPAIVYEERLAPSDGTLNRIYRIRADANYAYVAAGDLGLRTYDLVDFGVPFPIVRSFVGRSEQVVDLGNGQIVATSVNVAPRLYTIQPSGAVREVTRWEEQVGTVALDHAAEVTLLGQAGRVRLVRPSGTVTGEVSFGAAVESAVALDGTIWAVLFDRTLWRVPLTGGVPARVDLPGALPSFVSRGSGRLVVGSFNDEGTTTIHEIDVANPQQSRSITIAGLATSGAAVGPDTIAVATFRGLSLLDLDSGSELLVPLGGILPRDLAVSSGEIVVLGSDRLQRRRLTDGALVREIPILSPGLALDAETSVVVGASDAVYVLDLDTTAEQPVSLGRLTPSRFFDDLVTSNDILHLVEGESVTSRILQNQGLTSHERLTTFAGDLVDVAATSFGFCGLEGRGKVLCHDGAGKLLAAGEIPALDDVTWLSIHAVGSTVLVSRLEGCLSVGCRKVTAVATIASGSVTVASEIEGEIVSLSRSGDRIAVVTSLPDELRIYDVSSASPVPSLVAARAIGPESYAVALDGDRSAVYVAGQAVTAFSAAALAEIGQVLGPIAPGSGLSPRDQRIEIIGNHAIVTGRSEGAVVYRIDGPSSWSVEQAFTFPGIIRRMVRGDGMVALLSDFSIELLDTSPPLERRRSVRP